MSTTVDCTDSSTVLRLPTDLTVVDCSIIADDVISLAFRAADDQELPPWMPGAHLELRVGDGTMRHYSLCGSPHDRRQYQIAVLRQRDGRGGSDWMHGRSAGDSVHLESVRNHFQLDEATEYRFVAGGIGITPILAMARELSERDADWSLLYGGRSRSSMPFIDDLTKSHDGRVILCPQDLNGLLDLESFLTPRSDGGSIAVYACGPEGLLQALAELTATRSDLTLHLERFAPREADHEAVDLSFEVKLRGSGKTVEVSAQESIIDALQRSGVDVPFSCREGICGTCETTVLEGVPDHRDSLLDDDERAANDVMMICVSRCRGARLVLDI